MPREDEAGRASEGQHHAGRREPRHETSGARLERAGAQRRDGLDARGFEGRAECRQERGPEPDHDPLHGRLQGERRAADGDHVVEVVDGARDEPNRALPEPVPEAEAERGAEGGREQRLREDQAEELARGRAERAQRCEDRAALDDTEEHRVVDQEHADHERQQAQGGEVGLEGLGQLCDARRLLAGRSQARPRRQQAGQRGFGRFPAAQDQIHVADAAGHAEQALGGAHVQKQQAVERAAAFRVRRLHEAQHAERLAAVAGLHPER